MATLVTPTEVEEIYDGTVNQVTIDAAHQIIDKLLDSCDYSDAEKKEIERWLAAHFQSSADGENGVTQIQQGERSKTSSAQYGMKLDASRYGQMALALDTCGGLDKVNRRKASFDVL